MTSTQATVVSIWRYPVKSMMGEELNASDITSGGLVGDRAYALIDAADGKIASAKNPRKWPHLFDFRAALAENPSAKPLCARITLPDGASIQTGDSNVHQVLSRVLGREVTLRARVNDGRNVVQPSSEATAEAYWPDIEGLDQRETVTEFALPEGTFFDAAVVHLLTTSTLDHLRARYPQGRFEARRFRPNLVLDTAAADQFPEDGWVGRVLAIGDTVRLHITRPCARCVMTTLAQGDLPSDNGILRTAALHNHANVGVYASVLQAGRIRRGDSVTLE